VRSLTRRHNHDDEAVVVAPSLRGECRGKKVDLE
jgi:hypothetical protein